MVTTVKNSALTVLIAEDSAPDRLILESIVKKSGHIPVVAADGAQAVQAFEKHLPDIVLLDVLMPVMGGVEAAKIIRGQTQDTIVPIIFLTSLSDDESLVECIEAGGDDFLTKPYNRVVLESKIKALTRVREMHKTMVRQKQTIELHNQHLIREQTVAKQLYDKIAHSGCLDLNIIKYYMSPQAVFNGDVLVAEVGPAGNMMILLGDFTGHGLPAAIGSMPLASTFYGMVRKGFSMLDILTEINSKLHDILPIGFFCCATCIDVNLDKRRLKVWSGGMPDSMLYKVSTNSYEIIKAKNLPLGVLSEKEFKCQEMRLPLEPCDRFFMWSDGIVEARNEDGEMFGDERLRRLLERRPGSPGLFDEIIGQVHNHIGTSDKDDDISVIELDVQHIPKRPAADETKKIQEGHLQDWAFSFYLATTSLEKYDPLPLIINLINDVPGLKERSSTLYTVLAELYANALEHGVLGLSSELKATPSGFAEFYDLKHARLSALDEGNIEIDLQHKLHPDGGELTIRILDSGAGFDFAAREAESKVETTSPGQSGDSLNFHGRGFDLLESICDRIVVHPPGNCVEVAFVWKRDDVL